MHLLSDAENALHPPWLSNITLNPQLQGLGYQHLQGGVSAEGQFELNPTPLTRNTTLPLPASRDGCKHGA